MSDERWDRTTRVSVWLCCLMLLVLGGAAWHRRTANSPVPLLYPRVDAANQVMHSGRELVLVFIGSSKCGASAVPALPAALDSIRASAARYAASVHDQFSSLGIAVDQQPNDGLLFLKKFGVFDQIAVGHNWLNAAAISYIWRETPGPGSLPQVVLVERQLDVTGDGVSVGADRILARKTGSDGLIRWAAQGAPIIAVSAR